MNATLLDQNGKETATKDAVAVLSTTTDADATNNFVTYQDNDIAKAVLNYAGHLALGKNETLTAKVQVNVVNGCDQKLDVANNTFDVKFLRPISIEATDGSLEDAKDNGSDLALKDAMQFVDWRGFEFVPDNMNYFEYYGVETIAINVDDIMLGGKKLKDVFLLHGLIIPKRQRIRSQVEISVQSPGITTVQHCPQISPSSYR